MATPVKMGDGRWMCRAYNKVLKKQKRFYSETKWEALRLASEYAGTTKEEITATQTFLEAAETFLEDRSRVLSPNTMRGYKGVLAALKGIHDFRVEELDSKAVQRLVNQMAGEVSPKTVMNRYGFITAVLKYANPEIRLNVKLPERPKKKIVMPSEAEIKAVLLAVKDTILEVPVMLALFGPMRRGEISALDASNISGNVVHVQYAIAKDENGQYVRKSPKTAAGDRYIIYPQFVVDKLPKEGKVTYLTPDAITRRTERLMKDLGMKYTFHQLRHWSVSYLHRAGLSDQEILDRAGWSSTGIFKEVYRHGLKEEDRAVRAFEKFGG